MPTRPSQEQESLHDLTAQARSEEIKYQASRSHDKFKEEELKESLRQQWPWLRKTCYGIVDSHWFEVLCGAVILFNMILVACETDARVDDGKPAFWIEVATNCLLMIYTTELLMKFYAYRLLFFRDMWNNLDFFVIGIDLVFLAISLVVDKMPSMSILRVFRLVRLVRAFKAAKSFHELNSLLRACTCALKAIFWGMVMISLTLIVWGILAVQLIHPINHDITIKKPWIYADCERCPRAFSTVFDSILTFWKQLVAGDSWGTLCEPIIEEQKWTFLFFVMVLVTVSLTMLNCILAVVVEAGAAAAVSDAHDVAIQLEKTVMKAEGTLIDLCHGLDVDASGSLSIEEFLNGFRNNKNFRECLEVMHVSEADMFMIFNICDEDHSGEVDYVEFVDQLRRIKHSSQEMLLHYVTDIRHMVTKINQQIVPAPSIEPPTPRIEKKEEKQPGSEAARKGIEKKEDNEKRNEQNEKKEENVEEILCSVHTEERPTSLVLEMASFGGAADSLDSTQMKVEKMEQSSVATQEAIRNAEIVKLESNELDFHMHRMKIEMEHIYRINADLVTSVSNGADVALNKLALRGGDVGVLGTDLPAVHKQQMWSHPASTLSQSSRAGQPNGDAASDFAHFANSGIPSVQSRRDGYTRRLQL